MSVSEESCLFFLRTPRLNDLVSLVLQVNPKIQAENGKTFFHMRILKCRELIFTEPVVASPKLSLKNQIVCIVSRKRNTSPEFHAKLERMGLIVAAVGEANLCVLQECIQYTIIAKLAPSWNQVENVLVQGRDFLTTTDPLNAVKMDIVVSHNEIRLSLQAACVKFPQLKMEHFEHSKQFENSITEVDAPYPVSISVNEMCYVLPSLRKARVVSISNYLSAQSNYQNYSDLKKHWKNMYGYRLPDLPNEKAWYLNIMFRTNDITYTYPMCCVRPFGLIAVPRVDPRKALSAFVGEFCKKFDNVCGEKCQILELKAAFPKLELYSANRWSQDTKPRVGTTYTMPKGLPYKRDLIPSRKSQANERKAANLASNKPMPPPPPQEIKTIHQDAFPVVATAQQGRYAPKFLPKIPKKTVFSPPSTDGTLKTENRVIPNFSAKQVVTVRRQAQSFGEQALLLTSSSSKTKRKKSSKQSTLLELVDFMPKVKKVASGGSEKRSKLDVARKNQDKKVKV